MSGTTLCPRCGAPIPWDGSSKTVNCPYCQIVVTPSSFGAPPKQVPAMSASNAGAGLGVGCIVAIAVGALVMILGGAAAFFTLRSGSATTTPVVTISTSPAIITTAATPSATPTSPPLLTFGEAGNGAGQLTHACALAVDMDENVYTADYDTLRVQKFDATGKFQWIVLVSKDEFGNKQIWAMTVDAKNVLWVSRTGALLKLATANGKSIGAINGNYDNHLWYKWVALDPVGNIATTHDAAGDADLLLLDPNGKLKKRIKNKSANGLAFDGAGNVYRTESMDGVVEVLDANGEVKSKFGSRNDKHTRDVAAIAIDGKGHIFASTGEGIDVFDQGGGYVKTLPHTAGSVRSIAVSSKNHLFYLDGDKVTKLDIGVLP